MQQESTIHDLEAIPNKPIAPQILEQVLGVLNQSEDAAYTLFLLLGKRFGAGQKLPGSRREDIQDEPINIPSV